MPLAAELRRLREQANMTGQAAAKELGWQHSKLTRIEKADQGVKLDDLDQLMALYSVQDASLREGLLQLARDAKQRGWWADYRDVFSPGALPDFEAEASAIRCFEAQVIPGLFQTPRYIEAIFRGGAAHAPEVIQRHVQARLERQRILEGVHPVKVDAVIDEGALRRLVGGPHIMSEQLQHLLNLAPRPNIDIRVLPFSAGAHAAVLGSFIILEFEDPLDPSLAFTEGVGTRLIVEEADQLDRYTEVYGHLLGAALCPDPSVEFIQKVMEETVQT